MCSLGGNSVIFKGSWVNLRYPCDGQKLSRCYDGPVAWISCLRLRSLPGQGETLYQAPCCPCKAACSQSPSPVSLNFFWCPQASRSSHKGSICRSCPKPQCLLPSLTCAAVSHARVTLFSFQPTASPTVTPSGYRAPPAWLSPKALSPIPQWLAVPFLLPCLRGPGCLTQSMELSCPAVPCG